MISRIQRVCVPRYTVAVTMLACALILPTIARGEPAANASLSADGVAGFLVLTNGNVLAGDIFQSGDFYFVRSANSELRVPAEQVQSFCRNLQEAYHERRQRRTGSSADAHLELMRWCIRHNLLDEAAEELVAARAIDANDPAIVVAERRLRHATLQQAAKPPRQQPPAAVEQKPVTEATPRVAPFVRTAFVRQIQPLLVQSCAASGCHQPSGSESFQLDRMATMGVGHPEGILRNLAATLAIAEERGEAENMLERYARQSHGETAGTASLPLEPHQLDLLRGWIAAANTPQPQIAARHQVVRAQAAGTAWPWSDAVSTTAAVVESNREEVPEGAEPVSFADMPPRREVVSMPIVANAVAVVKGRPIMPTRAATPAGPASSLAQPQDPAPVPQVLLPEAVAQ